MAGVGNKEVGRVKAAAVRVGAMVVQGVAVAGWDMACPS